MSGDEKREERRRGAERRGRKERRRGKEMKGEEEEEKNMRGEEMI